MALIKDCATLEVHPDGLDFLPDSVVAEDIAKDSEYKRTRITMGARMSNVRLRVQVNFGVGDVMVPGARMMLVTQERTIPSTTLGKQSRRKYRLVQ